jgi:hypothetical protein
VPDRAFTVEVGWTSSRPIRPDEHFSRVRVVADSDVEAVLTALHMVGTAGNPDGADWRFVGGRPVCVMTTSALLLDWP